MTHALEAELREGLRTLGLSLCAAQQNQLLAHLDLLAKWSRVYNLTAVRDPRAMLTHHLLDCLAIIRPLQRHAGGRPVRVLDAGSGGGLPGVAIAICCPETRVTCVDSVQKKAAFMQQAKGALGLDNLRIEHSRVQDLPGQFDVIVSRAFAALEDFVGMTRGLLAPGGVWLGMKGRNPAVEIETLPEEIEAFHVEQLLVPGLAADRCLVWMRVRSGPD